MTILPSSGPYFDILRGYLGFLTPTQKDDYWKDFLKSNGFAATPPVDNTNLGLFTTYVNGIYGALLPGDFHDVEKNRIVVTIFDILIAMMKKMTDSQLSLDKGLLYYTKKQGLYADLALRAPVYIGHTPFGDRPQNKSFIIVNGIDPSKYNLGYADVTMAEVYKYMLNAYQQNGHQEVAFTLASDARLEPFNTLDGTVYYRVQDYIRITVYDGGGGAPAFSSQTIKQELQTVANRPVITDVSLPVQFNFVSGADEEAQHRSMQQIFMQSFAQNSRFQANPPGIGWQIDPVPPSLSGEPPIHILYVAAVNATDKQKAAASSAASKRASRNARIQTFLDGIRSRREVLGDLGDAMQRVVESAGQGRSQMSNIIQSTIKQLGNILNSIFR